MTTPLKKENAVGQTVSTAEPLVEREKSYKLRDLKNPCLQFMKILQLAMTYSQEGKS